jgi:hypothetical protein
MANTTFQNQFRDDAGIQALRAAGDPAVQTALNVVGGSSSSAGYFLQKTPFANGISADVIAQIREISGRAFISGMDQATWVAGIALIGAGIVSYFLVKDSVFEVKLEEQPAPAGDLVANPAD